MNQPAPDLATKHRLGRQPPGVALIDRGGSGARWILLWIAFLALGGFYVGSFVFLKQNSVNFTSALDSGITVEILVEAIESSPSEQHHRLIIPLNGPINDQTKVLFMVNVGRMRAAGIDVMELREVGSSTSVSLSRWPHSNWCVLAPGAQAQTRPEATRLEIEMTTRGFQVEPHDPRQLFSDIYVFGDDLVNLDQWYTFGAGGTASALTRFGWSIPEPNGRWTDQPAAELCVQLPPLPGGDLVIQAELRAYVVPENPTMRVYTRVNDTDVGVWVFSLNESGGTREIVVPTSTLADSGRMTIELILKDPASPLELGRSSDGRRLGVFVRRIRFLSRPSKPTVRGEFPG